MSVLIKKSIGIFCNFILFGMVCNFFVCSRIEILSGEIYLSIDLRVNSGSFDRIFLFSRCVGLYFDTLGAFQDDRMRPDILLQVKSHLVFKIVSELLNIDRLREAVRDSNGAELVEQPRFEVRGVRNNHAVVRFSERLPGAGILQV